MKQSDIPARFPIPFANNAGVGYIRPIPTAHVTPSPTDAPASLFDGFPPETFTPLDTGGVPPNGEDMNGILFQITAWSRWQAAGGPQVYNSAFSTAIGGYPKGASLASTTLPGPFWTSTADDNTTDPDGGSPANWIMDDRVIAQNLIANGGYRQWASGFKDCWGRVIVPAGGNVTVTVPITHTGFIDPSISSEIANSPGSNNMVGISPVDLNTFVLRNWDTANRVVNWRTAGS